MNGPESELDHYLLREMCAIAPVAVELQCEREYWAGNDEDVTPCATQINRLTSDEQENLPTYNLNCERYLAKFEYLAAQPAVHSNKLFKVKIEGPWTALSSQIPRTQSSRRAIHEQDIENS